MKRLLSNLPFLLALSYILFMTIWPCFSVGHVPPQDGKPYPWTLPVLMFAIVACPAWLGWDAGRRYERNVENDT